MGQGKGLRLWVLDLGCSFTSYVGWVIWQLRCILFFLCSQAGTSTQPSKERSCSTEVHM